MNDYIKSDFFSWTKRKDYQICAHTPNCSLKEVIENIEEDFPSIDEKDNKRFNVVYCYSLSNQKFEYPNGNSNVLYIGYTIGQKKKSKISLSFRFVHCKEGKDCKSNMCLRHYYKNNIPLTLEIYQLPENNCAQTEELKLRKRFLEEYASLPIADGASYKKS